MRGVVGLRGNRTTETPAMRGLCGGCVGLMHRFSCEGAMLRRRGTMSVRGKRGPRIRWRMTEATATPSARRGRAPSRPGHAGPEAPAGAADRSAPSPGSQAPPEPWRGHRRHGRRGVRQLTRLRSSTLEGRTRPFGCSHARRKSMTPLPLRWPKPELARPPSGDPDLVRPEVAHLELGGGAF